MTTLLVAMGCLAGFGLGYWLGRKREEKNTWARIQEKTKEAERWKAIANYAASEGVDILAAKEVAELERLFRE
jgi:hypothetical protein